MKKQRSDKGNYKKEDSIFVCMNCLNSLSHHKYHLGRQQSQKTYSYAKWAERKYCSIDCRNQYVIKNGSPKITRSTEPCLECGEIISRENIKFCSKKCFYKNKDMGISTENEKARKSASYKTWRKAVFERDNYTCQGCGLHSGNGKAVTLNADHIKPFAFFKQLRYDINNGRTLCADCHKSTPTYGFGAWRLTKERQA